MRVPHNIYIKTKLKKQCKKCGIDFQPTKGLINYCSLNCRNSRIWSDSDKLKKSKAARTSEKAIKQRESLKSKEIIDKITKTNNEIITN